MNQKLLDVVLIVMLLTALVAVISYVPELDDVEWPPAVTTREGMVYQLATAREMVYDATGRQWKRGIGFEPLLVEIRPGPVSVDLISTTSITAGSEDQPRQDDPED